MSPLEKSLSESGINGTFIGSITIIPKLSGERGRFNKMIPKGLTIKNDTHHYIQVWIGGDQIKDVWVENDDEIPDLSSSLLELLTKRLKILAHGSPPVSTYDKLKASGYHEVD